MTFSRAKIKKLRLFYLSNLKTKFRSSSAAAQLVRHHSPTFNYDGVNISCSGRRGGAGS
jgi:hypothetical protein